MYKHATVAFTTDLLQGEIACFTLQLSLPINHENKLVTSLDDILRTMCFQELDIAPPNDSLTNGL